jgi:hypothetical protein
VASGAKRWRVDGKMRRSFDDAAGAAVSLAVQRSGCSEGLTGEVVCIEEVVRGQVVARIDVTASLSTDPIE